MRAFIAVNLSDNAKQVLINYQSMLKERGFAGNYSLKDNLHITLAFLGEIPEDKVKTVISAAESVKREPFKAHFGFTGRFGSLLWVGVNGCKEIFDLAENLRESLASKGIGFDAKPFRPHITLCREFVCDEPLPRFSGFDETVLSFELMKSERVNGLLRYTSRFSRKLIDKHE